MSPLQNLRHLSFGAKCLPEFWSWDNMSPFQNLGQFGAFCLFGQNVSYPSTSFNVEVEISEGVKAVENSSEEKPK